MRNTILGGLTAGVAALALHTAAPAMAASFLVQETDVTTVNGTSAAPNNSGCDAIVAAGAWCEYNRDTGTADWESSFGAPAGFGADALTLDTVGSGDKATVSHAFPANTPLSSLTDISYHTYRDGDSTASPLQLPALNIGVFLEGTSAFRTLVFEPVYTAQQSNVTWTAPTDQWTMWDADGSAMYWVTGAGAPAACGNFTCTLDQIVAAYPNARALTFAVNQGSGNPGLYAAVDGLTIGGNTYDFGTAVPTKDDCKNGGWATRFPSGTYRNQGECVSFFARRD
jgi:hypothetical protein